jgi:hypothetical protein
VPSFSNAPDPVALDGFGHRAIGVDSEHGDQVELLELASWLVDHSGFVAALGERVARFASVRHASYAQLRRLDRPAPDRLVLISDATPGWRLSDLLNESSNAGVPLDITVVIGLMRQLLAAVALYGRHNRDAAIGTLGPERLIVTPQARVVIAEHAFGPALEKLNLGRDRLWREWRVCMPPSAGLPRANQRADAHGLGVVTLSLLLGRSLTLDEFPAQLPSLVEQASEYRDGARSPLPAAFANWLFRALQLDTKTALQSPADAQLAFESLLASDRAYLTSATRLEEWVAQVGGSIEGRRRPPEPEASASACVESGELPPGEGGPVAPRATAARQAPKALMLAMAGVILLLLAAVAWLTTGNTDTEPREGEGELVVQSRPPGATVLIDGTSRGVTPSTVALPSGAHVLEVQAGTAEPRVIPLMIRAGGLTAQYVELQEPPPSPPQAEKARNATGRESPQAVDCPPFHCRFC